MNYDIDTVDSLVKRKKMKKKIVNISGVLLRGCAVVCIVSQRPSAFLLYIYLFFIYK